MKKRLLIPTIAALAATPMISLTSCVVDVGGGDTPEPTPPEPVGTFQFSFTGTYCTLNGSTTYSEDIISGRKNVRFTVLPLNGYQLSATQALPSGVSLEGNILEISEMDKQYSVNVVAEQVGPVISVTGVDITSSASECWTGRKLSLEYKVLPEGATDSSVTWLSTNPNIATVNSTTGEITPVSSGEVGIIVRTNDGGFVDTCLLTVKQSVESIQIGQKDSMNLYLGYGDRQLSCHIQPQDATIQDVSWESSDTTVATVDSETGLVSPKKEGTTIITASAKDGSGVTDTCEITVYPKETPLCFEKNPGSDVDPVIWYELVGSPWTQIPQIQYSLNGGEWENWTYNTNIGESERITLGNDDKLLVRNKSNTLSSKNNFFNFVCDDETDTLILNASGNIDSLINYSSLTPYCYKNMFVEFELIIAPDLPSTDLAEGCYNGSFQSQWFLTLPPDLPSTDLADWCYFNMFGDCPSLITAPELPATQLSENCYSSMFYGCSSLTTIESLNITTLDNSCCNTMFGFCSSLKIKENTHDQNDLLVLDLSGGFSPLPEYSFTAMFDHCFPEPGYFTGTPTLGNRYYLDVE